MTQQSARGAHLAPRLKTPVPKMRTPVPKMRTPDPEERVLEAYYEFPSRQFSIRSLSKETKLPKSTVERVLQTLKKEGILDRGNRPTQSALFALKKINHFTERIVSSGVIGFLEEQMSPSCIILFGSIRKGESAHDSDIDIFVEAPKKNVPDLSAFEKKLGHGIEVFAQESISGLPAHLFNNVVNGIRLAGYLKLK